MVALLAQVTAFAYRQLALVAVTLSRRMVLRPQTCSLPRYSRTGQTSGKDFWLLLIFQKLQKKKEQGEGQRVGGEVSLLL